MHVSGRVRAVLASVLLVLALLAGGLAGTLTSGGATSGAASAQQPVPVLRPVAAGPQPPSGQFVAGLFPPDPKAQAAAAQAAVKAHPDQFPTPPATTAPSAPAGRPGPERVAGYADGSGYFHHPPGPSGVGSTAAGPGTSSPASTSGPGAGGFLHLGNDFPILIDVCAGDSPPPGCHGVSGTIHPLNVRIFLFAHDPQAVSGLPGECTGTAPGSGQFVFELTTTNLGSFTVRYRIAGSGAAYTQVTGASPSSWRSVLDADPTRKVVTCILAQRPAFGDQRLEVDVAGVGVDGSGTDHFTGTISLPGAGGPSAGQRRNGRPPVTVEALTSSTLQVDVPVGQHESAKVSLVSPAVAGGTGEPCLTTYQPAITKARPYQPASVQPAGQTSNRAWTDSDFRVSAPRAGSYAVCVSWFDNSVPPRNIERADIPVQIASIGGGQVLLAGYNTALYPEEQPRRITVSISTDSGATCLAPTITPDQYVSAPDRTHAASVCRFDGVGSLGVEIDSYFGSGQPLVTRALLRAPTHCVPAAGCTLWWTPFIYGPTHAFDGAVVIGIHAPGGSGSATIGAEHPVQTARPRVRGARLVDGGVSVTVSPADPRTVLATWASDQPATVLATATPQNGASTDCPVKTSARNARLATSGTITITGLCPGVSYWIGFDLFNSGRDRTIYSLDSPQISGADIVRWAWGVTTSPLPVKLDYKLNFQLTDNGRPLNIGGVVPVDLSLQFPTDVNRSKGFRLAQFYSGSPWIGMSCAHARYYDRSKRGLTLNLSGGSLTPTDSRFEFSLYWPSRRGIFDTGSGVRCPSLYNQVNHTPTRRGTSWDCSFVITSLHPAGGSNSLYRLLSGAQATFTATDSCWANPSIRLTATLTVRMGQVRTLYGHV